jgi:membrane protease YdiL (CAAX protease family)
VIERPPIAEFPAAWRALFAYVLLGAVLLATVLLPIATCWRGEALALDAIGALGLFQGQAVLAAFLLSWFVLQDRDSWRSFLHLPRGRWIARIAESMHVGVRGWLITMAAMVVLGVLARRGGVTPHERFADLIVWMAQRPVSLRVALIAVAMVVEEAFFRAFLQPRVGLALATLWFALSHVNYGSPMMGGGVLVIGWIFGRTFRRTDDLAICAIAHGTFDAIQLLVILPLIAARM